MVVIHPCTPFILNAYSTTPITNEISLAVQTAIYDGGLARVGQPPVIPHLYDRSDFHNASHYTIRTTLDAEGMKDDFIVIDSDVLTPIFFRPGDTEPYSTNHVFLIYSTEESNDRTERETEAGEPPISYPNESFVLWRARFNTIDVPSIFSYDNDAAAGQLYNWFGDVFRDHYDPHDPQREPFKLEGYNWTDGRDTEFYWYDAYITANFSEIEYTTNETIRRQLMPWSGEIPPAAIRLTEMAAREAGLERHWYLWQTIPRVNETFNFTQRWDFDSPKWPLPYPIEPVDRQGKLGAASARHGALESRDGVKAFGDRSCLGFDLSPHDTNVLQRPSRQVMQGSQVSRKRHLGGMGRDLLPHYIM